MPGPAYPTRVLISYSHDSEAHIARVLQLAQRLREDGVDAWLDQFEPAPAEGWPRWMQRQVERAEFVVFVCTSTYRRRYEGREAPGTGNSVAWEGMLASQLQFENRFDHRTLVPVLLEGASQDEIPTTLRAGTFHELPAGYYALLRRLTGVLAAKPRPLGQPSVYPGHRSVPDVEDPDSSPRASARYDVSIERMDEGVDADQELMVVEPVYTQTEDDRLELAFRTAFRRHRIPQGESVQTFVEVVATSAWHGATVDHAGIEDCSAEAIANCKVTPVWTSKKAEWSCDLDEEHGFLEGNVLLQLAYRANEPATFVSEAHPTNIALRNATGQVIGSLFKVMAVRVRLWASGVRMPVPHRVRHRIVLSPVNKALPEGNEDHGAE